MKARLEANGINVVGVTDHGFVKSIYFFDPNGIRLEFTAETVEPGGVEGVRPQRARSARGLDQGKGRRPASPPRPDVLLSFQSWHRDARPARVSQSFA